MSKHGNATVILLWALCGAGCTFAILAVIAAIAYMDAHTGRLDPIAAALLILFFLGPLPMIGCVAAAAYWIALDIRRKRRDKAESQAVPTEAKQP
jgi:hypothetical protein